MTDRDRSDRSKKTVGQNPLAGLEGLDLAGPDLADGPDLANAPVEPVEPAAETGSPPQKTEVEPGDLPVLAETGRAAVNREPKSGDEPEAAADHLLDDLISAIDVEIDRAFGRRSVSEPDSDEAPPPPTVNQEQYVIFRLAGVRYAASVANIREMSEATWLTPVPNTPAWLQGVTNLRGDVLSVVDLQGFLALKQVDHEEAPGAVEGLSGPEQEILVAHSHQNPGLITVGFTVDTVSDIRYLDTDKIVAPGASFEAQIGPYLQGLYEEGDHFLVVLDFEKLLLSPALRRFEPV